MPDLVAGSIAHVLEAALLGAPVLVGTLVAVGLARRRPAALRHALWTGALAAQAVLLVAPGVVPEIGVPGWPGWLTDPVAAMAPETEVPAASVPRGPELDGPVEASGPAGGASRDAGLAPGEGRSRGPGSGGLAPGGMLGLLWGGGVSLSLLHLLAGLVTRRRWWRGADRAPAAVERQVRSCARDFGIRRKIRVRLGPARSTPVTWGVLRPALLLPATVPDWPEERVRAVVLHELAHVRRLDALSRGLAEALSVLLWFDPLIWVARCALRTTSEEAADDAVLSAEVRPSRYVAHLAAAAEELLAAPPAPSHSILGRGRRLERRASAILGRGRSRPEPSIAPGLAVTAAAGLLALPLASFHRVEEPPDGLAHRMPVECRYDGGHHLDRVTREGDRRVWTVEWEGTDCRVDVRARGRVTFASDLSGLGSVAPGGRLEIQVRKASRSVRFVAWRAAEGRVEREWHVDGGLRPPARGARRWLGEFLVELDRHTAFAAEARLPALLAEGGAEAVLREAARGRGGHAGGLYLRRLVESTRLSDEQVGRALGIADRLGTVDAVMSELLAAVREGYDVSSPEIEPAFRRAVRALRSEAARAEARSPSEARPGDPFS